jgi:hypothetical protein
MTDKARATHPDKNTKIDPLIAAENFMKIGQVSSIRNFLSVLYWNHIFNVYLHV